MLQKKLVIAMCAAFALTACGGDDNDDQSRIVLNPPEDINPPTPPSEEEEDTVEWLNVVFDEETDVDAWEAACVTDGCNATAELAYNADAEAMDVTPEFLDAGDQIEISAPIDPEIADLTDGNAHLNLFVPEAYAGMIAQVFFQNAGDQKAYIGYRATEAGWNTFSFEGLDHGTGVDNDYGDFGYHGEGFDLTLINRMGVQIQSADGFVGVEGTLHIDDAIVSPEAIEVADKGGDEEPTEPSNGLSFTFDDGIDGWYIDGADGSTQETDNVALSHDAENGALVITPKTWDAIGENWNYQTRINIDETDLSSAVARVEIDIPEAYITDGGLTVQFATSGDGSWTDAPVALEAGMNTIDFDLSNAAPSAEVTVGIQLSTAPNDTSILEPISVHSINVYPDGEVPSNTLSVSVSEGWQNDSTPTTFTYDNGVVMTPDWTAGDEQKGFGLTTEPLDLTGATITYVIDVPEAYVTDGGMVIQPFAQQNSGDFEGIFDGALPGGWNPASGLQAGENTIVFGPFDTAPADIERIGVNLLEQDKADGVTGDVIVRSVTINFPE